MYPAYIHTQATARNIDHAAIETYQIPSLILMEHAAIESTKIIEKHITIDKSICILCGPGNNGADGLAIARLLQTKYSKLFVVVPEVKNMSEEEKIQFQMIQNLNIEYDYNLPNGYLKCSQFPSCVDFTGFNCIQNCVYCYYLSFFSKIALKHRPHYFHI